MHLRTRSKRPRATEQSRPSTGMSPPMVPVDGDYYGASSELTVADLVNALARHVTPNDDRTFVRPVEVGGFMVWDLRRRGHGTK